MVPAVPARVQRVLLLLSHRSGLFTNPHPRTPSTVNHDMNSLQNKRLNEARSKELFMPNDVVRVMEGKHSIADGRLVSAVGRGWWIVQLDQNELPCKIRTCHLLLLELADADAAPPPPPDAAAAAAAPFSTKDLLDYTTLFDDVDDDDASESFSCSARASPRAPPAPRAPPFAFGAASAFGVAAAASSPRRVSFGLPPMQKLPRLNSPDPNVPVDKAHVTPHESSPVAKTEVVDLSHQFGPGLDFTAPPAPPALSAPPPSPRYCSSPVTVPSSSSTTLTTSSSGLTTPSLAENRFCLAVEDRMVDLVGTLSGAAHGI